MPEVPLCYIVTGSLTQEGSVAYLRADGSWTCSLAEAQPFEDEVAAKSRLAEVQGDESVITEPYVFRAERNGSQIRPVSAREILRSAGPSTRLRRPDRAGAKAS